MLRVSSVHTKYLSFPDMSLHDLVPFHRFLGPRRPPTLHSLGTYQNERKQNTAPLVLGSMTSPVTYQTELKVPCTYQNSRTMYQNERKQNLAPLVLGSMTSLATYQTECMV